MKTSQQLTLGNLYTREELKRKFNITDATINTGIFQPKGHDSLWLFVTEEKTPDRTQYQDRLLGDDLFIEGKTAGRKDVLLADHEKKGLEILLFFRKNRFEHPGAAFQYEGQYSYVGHKATRPAQFHFRRVL